VSLRKDSPAADTSPPFKRILIANRGEIAVRVIRACRELGIESVAVYSDADADALHARLADVAVNIGPAAAAESYLRIDRVIEAATATAAEALHPGYGFLSEQPGIADACTAAGITFIGPSREALDQLGDKLAARRRAAAAGVPVVPGIFEPISLSGPDGEERVRAEAERVGYPVLVKAAAGGGGRGMRRVDAPAELIDAVQGARREAAAAFGDASVFLERYVERARHVEVQLLGDNAGHIVALGERDCSVQRRHQKLVEEAPAPGLSADERRTLHELGVKVAATVGLRNAATAEFLLTPEGEFWFLEVNARLQVEHGVTELVCDLDLVHEQIAIAAGQPLSKRVLAAAARAAHPDRHAIEVRLTAEDPALEFAPNPGRVTVWRPADGPGVRVDAGIEEGSDIPGDYDSMFAKLMVVAPTRPEAIERMKRALRETRIAGVQTTVPFDRWLLEQPSFTDETGAGLSTDLIARTWEPAALVAKAALRAAELAAVAVRESVGSPDQAPPTGCGRLTNDDGWWSAGVREALEGGT
jgi:3-methylcrotonyl-CoA carboxylase alpha subunit